MFSLFCPYFKAIHRMSTMEKIHFDPPASNTFFIEPEGEDTPFIVTTTADNSSSSNDNTIVSSTSMDKPMISMEKSSSPTKNHVLRVTVDSPTRTRSESDTMVTSRNTLSPPPMELPQSNNEQPHRRSFSLTPEPTIKVQKSNNAGDDGGSSTGQNNGLLSPNRVRPKIKRRETVDTSTINREDHEVRKWREEIGEKREAKERAIYA